jgi:hypothetical protein
MLRVLGSRDLLYHISTFGQLVNAACLRLLCKGAAKFNWGTQLHTRLITLLQKRGFIIEEEKEPTP